jgi:hypothetical protein
MLLARFFPDSVTKKCVEFYQFAMAFGRMPHPVRVVMAGVVLAIPMA